jgi:Fur family ferric uptake transcriptional regulator
VASKESYVTAVQIAEHLQKEHVFIARPTIYRQLEKLASQGKVRKYLFGGTSVSSFRYVEPAEHESNSYRLKCEACDGIFNIDCAEVSQVSRHIFESREFKVADTVFYGTCKTCLQK